MNADSVSKIFSVYTLMLRRIPLLADNPADLLAEQVLWQARALVRARQNSTSMGEGGCFMEVPRLRAETHYSVQARTLPVGLHWLFQVAKIVNQWMKPSDV
jgi:hypothetical protein